MRYSRSTSKELETVRVGDLLSVNNRRWPREIRLTPMRWARIMNGQSHNRLSALPDKRRVLRRRRALAPPMSLTIVGAIHGVQTMIFVVCISREGFGDDYLYPASLFAAVEVQQQTAKRLHDLLAAKRLAAAAAEVAGERGFEACGGVGTIRTSEINR